MARDLRQIQNIVVVCQGKDCKGAGGKDVLEGVKGALKDLGAHKQTMIVKSKCMGQCKRAPVMSVMPDNVWVTEATKESAAAIIHASLGTHLKLVNS